MNRRKFLATSGTISAAALLPLSCISTSDKPKFKLGYQLYSIRDEMAKDAVATLRKLKEMGYQDFEAYGFDAEKGQFYGHNATVFKNMLDDLELTITSGHYGFSPFLEKTDEELTRFVDQCISGAKAIDSKYITWPWMAPEQRTGENYKLMARKLNLIGEQIVAAGLGFAYHNHGFDFETYNGEIGYDIIMSETDPSLVKLEMDMYWVIHTAKRSPKELVKQQPGRFTLWHIKDMDKVTRDYTELGNGSIDYQEVLPDPVASGLEFFYIEQGGNFALNSIKRNTCKQECVPLF